MSLEPPQRPPLRRWFKVPYSQKLECIILSEAHTSIIHWTESGCRPCAGPECLLCMSGTGRQARYTFLVLCQGEVGLLEFTETHYPKLAQLEAKYAGTLVGAILELRRAQPRKNARLIVNSLETSTPLITFGADEVKAVIDGDTQPLWKIPVAHNRDRIAVAAEEQRLGALL